MSPQDSNQSHQNTEGATCQIDGAVVTESEDSVDAAAVRLAGENTDTDSVEKTGQVDNTDSRVVQSQTVEDTNVIPVTSSEQVILTETCDSLADTPHTDVIHSEDVPVTSSTHIDNAELNCTNTNTSIDSNNEQIPCTEIVDEGDENNVVTSPTQQEHSASSAQTLSNPTICVVECEDDDDNDEDESFVDAPSDQEEQSQIVTIVTESSDANTANQKCDSVEEKSSEI